MSVCDESLRSDSLKNEFLKPMLEKFRGQGDLEPLPSPHRVNWAMVVTIAACRLRFERFGLPMLYRPRHGAVSHGVFQPLSRRDGGTTRTFSARHSASKRVARLPQLLHVTSFQELPWPEVCWFTRCRDGVRIATEETILLLDSGGHVGVSTVEAHLRTECLHVSCVRVPVAGVSDAGSNKSAAPQRHIGGPMQSRKIGGLVLSNDGRNFSSVQARLLSGDSLPDHRAHEFLKGPVGTQVWVLTSPSRRANDHLSAVHVRRPSPCPCGDARSQRIREPSKHDPRHWSPSHSASLLDGQAPLEHHV